MPTSKRLSHEAVGIAMVVLLGVAPAVRAQGRGDDVSGPAAMVLGSQDEGVIMPSPARIAAPMSPPKRLVLVNSLLGTFAALEVADIYSTTRALEFGANEANPLMRTAATHPLALTTAK